MVKYILPDLSYDYGALEPHISGRIMELHHDKHHKTYVDNANKALEQMDEGRAKKDLSKIAAQEKALAFNLSGHVLHSLFWRNLKKDGGGKPMGALAQAIDRDFGNFEQFKAQMKETAATIMGSGWAALVYEPMAKRLLTTQIYDHQSNLNQAGIPLLVIDAWEHAYYLQYENRKTDFFEAIWNVFDYEDVAKRLETVSRMNIDIPGTVSKAA